MILALTPGLPARSRLALATTALVALLWPGLAAAADHYAKAEALLASGDLRGAQIEFRNAVRDDPESGRAHFGLADVDLRLGDPVGAEKEAGKARTLGFEPRRATEILLQSYLDQQRPRDLLETFPATGNPPDIAPTILAGRARADLMLDEPDRAVSEIEAARALAPTSPDVLLTAALVASAKGDAKAAAADVDAVLKADPQNAAALRRKAQFVAAGGDRPGAIAILDGLLTRDPNDVVARLQRADLLIASHQNDKAKEDIAIVQKSLPNNAQAVYLHALILAEAGDYKGAGADMQKLSSVLTRMPNAYYLDALVKNQLGESEQALDSAQRYVARFPADPRGVALLVQIDMARHAPDEAIAVLNKAILTNDKNPVFRELLGQVYLTTGKLAPAIASYEAASTLAPDNAVLLSRLGELKLDAGDDNGAAAAFERSLKLDPKQAKAGEMLVLTGIVAGDFSAAQTHLDEVRKEEGDNAVVGNLEGLLRLAEMDYPGAEAAFTNVLKAHPDSAAAKLSLARLQLIEGKNDAAWQLLDEVLAKEPGNRAALNIGVAALEQQGKNKEALALLAHAHEALPSDPAIAASYAALLFRGNDAKAALAVSVGKDQPPPVALLLVQGAAQASLGLADTARDTYRQILTADPGQTTARLDLARLLVAAKDYSGADSVIDAGLKAYPSNYDLMQASIGIALGAQGADAALARARALAQDATHLPAARALVGDLYIAQKQYDQAAKAYAAALADEPSTFLLMREVAANNAGGHRDNAQKLLTDWVANHDKDVPALVALADMEITAKQYQQAVAHLQTALSVQPNNTLALNNLAWVDQQLGKPEALKLAERAYLLAPGAQTADTLGDILLQTKNPAALALLREAHAELPADPAIQYHLAAALAQAGHRDEAAALLTPITGDKVSFAEKDAARNLLADLNAGK
jgi:putative PEP-CTERM system TPR-repeat lipoprotein